MMPVGSSLNFNPLQPNLPPSSNQQFNRASAPYPSLRQKEVVSYHLHHMPYNRFIHYQNQRNSGQHPLSYQVQYQHQPILSSQYRQPVQYHMHTFPAHQIPPRNTLHLQQQHQFFNQNWNLRQDNYLNLAEQFFLFPQFVQQNHHQEVPILSYPKHSSPPPIPMQQTIKHNPVRKEIKANKTVPTKMEANIVKMKLEPKVVGKSNGETTTDPIGACSASSVSVFFVTSKNVSTPNLINLENHFFSMHLMFPRVYSCLYTID